MGRKRKNEEQTEMEQDVHAALIANGWLTPTREDDVDAAEAELRDDPVELPADLADPAAVFERAASEAQPALLRFPGSPDIDATLARAAREGGTVTPEIEEIMRRDREAAEREMDDEAQSQ
ncbi:MAG: VOC family protein [Planctomycetota bacterium]|jgi:hypothetical protein